jgi:glycosyltransferase involved in cell wall biosynthesis
MTGGQWFPATVYYAGDGYSTDGPKIMGRQAAGQGFLRAYVEAAQAAKAKASAWLIEPSKRAALQAQQGFRHAGLDGVPEIVSGANMHSLANSGCLYVPQPGLHELASQRIRVGERKFSLCGITHTTASHAVMTTLAQLPLSPVRPWDAVICTSNAVLQSVQNLLAQQFEYLRWKLGATRFELPQLPVIPLGVHTQDYHFTSDQKQAARQSLGLQENDIAVLFVGRLSFHAKAHPHPMLVALQNVAKNTGRNIHLIQAGWFANDAIEQAFKQAGSHLAPDVRHHYIDGRDPEQRQNAWAAADIFCSLSDNIQETFGLTPIEAMAAALPVVVSDWDGYKDTVRHGIDGYRVRTHMPAQGDGLDLATLYERGIDNYDIYCGKVCEFVAIDIPQATQYFTALVTDKALRLRMGAQARQRALQNYDWGQVLQHYQSLWSELSAIRAKAGAAPKGPIPIAQAVDRPDPYTLFAGYPTQSLNGQTRLRLEQPVTQHLFEQTLQLGVHAYASSVLPKWPQAQAILNKLQMQDCTLDDLLAGRPTRELRQSRRHILWMMKVGWITAV